MAEENTTDKFLDDTEEFFGKFQKRFGLTASPAGASLNRLKKVLVEAGNELLMSYFQNECKMRLTDIYLNSPKYQLEEDLIMYETYIREIDNATDVTKMLEIYMEAADIMRKEPKETPFSKRK